MRINRHLAQILDPRPWAVAAASTLTLIGPAQAALFDRGSGMVYDDVLNITWLADWNQAETSGYDTNGLMSWAAATTWADQLVHAGYDDWRLPTALNASGSTCSGPDCSGSEMGHMFYGNWSAAAGSDFSTGSDTANLALFSHVQSAIYWSGTELAPNVGAAWMFDLGAGYQALTSKVTQRYAVAVRAGDIAPIPELQAWALMLLGLGTLAPLARRR